MSWYTRASERLSDEMETIHTRLKFLKDFCPSTDEEVRKKRIETHRLQTRIQEIETQLQFSLCF